MLQAPQVKPAKTCEEALERVRAFQALDDATIRSEAYTTLLMHGSRAPLAVVLLHGFTNHPGQFARFAAMVYESGANVFVPRMPEHGDRNRMTRRLAHLTAEQVLASATEAVDIACGLGERVCVVGISSSGVLCAYFAQYRSDVAKAIGIAPVFGVLQLPYWASRAFGKAAVVLPNRFLWWDPRAKEAQRPSTAYPQFPTRALGQMLRISDEVYDASSRRPMQGTSCVMVCNCQDPAVNNHLTEHVVSNWNALRSGSAEQFAFTNLPKNHDIVDPDNSRARTDVVYPALLELIRTT